MPNHPDMQYRPLGRCGTKVSQFSLGGWTTYGQLVKEQNVIAEILKTAYDRGINFFDIADAYGKGEAERVMGKILLENFPRHELVISSKVFFPMSDDVNDRGLSRKHIMESVERSLKNIGTDYLDIYFCHRYDEETPVEETLRAMSDLIQQGKIMYWGTSEWTGEQLSEVHELCEDYAAYHPQVEQPRYNLLIRDKFENDVQPILYENGMGAVTFSPLAFGFLTGKYDDGIPKDSRLDQIEWLRERVVTPENRKRSRKFKNIADKVGCNRAQLALAWTCAQDGVSSVITGASLVDQLEENLKALRIEITDEIEQEIEKIFPTEAVDSPI